MVVVGGGPTGVEFAGELQDFFNSDLKKWIPDITESFHVTLVEALPNVLPMFSKQLIDYTESTFRESKIEILTKTMVKEVLGGQLSSCSFTHSLQSFIDQGTFRRAPDARQEHQGSTLWNCYLGCSMFAIAC